MKLFTIPAFETKMEDYPVVSIHGKMHYLRESIKQTAQ